MKASELTGLAAETLDTFAQVERDADQKLASIGNASGAGSLASVNTFTGGQAADNISRIARENRETLLALRKEPAIARLLIEDEDGQQRVVYIARRGSVSLTTGAQLASYGSPLGRLAELPLGDDRVIPMPGGSQTFILLEKTNLAPAQKDGVWDSTPSHYRHVDKGVYSIDSLRALLQPPVEDAGDELDRLLERAAAEEGIKAGISHQTRTAMGLRDQPILDEFQGEIFRLPLGSQLIILGPPGTGKTTTLIKRLGQKLDVDHLDENERRSVEDQAGPLAHESNWLMFTPSELLKHYLKEAFNRESVPASDARIKTWAAYSHDIARNRMGILRSANGGRYTLKPDMDLHAAGVLSDPREWFAAFEAFHAERLKKQLVDGALMALESAPEASRGLAEQLVALTAKLEGRALTDVYVELNGRESELRQMLDESREIADQLLREERNRQYNRDKDIFNHLVQFLAVIQQEDEPDEDEEFDEDEPEVAVPQPAGSVQNAVKAYQGALRSLSRSRYRKRSMAKGARAGRVVEWLGDRLPEKEVLLEIGQRISFQNGLRRFINAFKRYVTDVPTSYRAFRKLHEEDPRYYLRAPATPLHLSSTELDAVVLLSLRNARKLVALSFIGRNLSDKRFESVERVASLFRTQVMVDEATDFSALQLACMQALSSPRGQSFFACGDFNQRITSNGIRSLDQLVWVSPRIEVKTINLVYRQSRLLNTFSGELLQCLGGDMSVRGELPMDSTHEGFRPVLAENLTPPQIADWIAGRVSEVERMVRQMPTIAVLVNSEDQVAPMAERLSASLEPLNLKAVACVEGKALGEGTDVRVFDIQHIKGLEFEAVFFVGVDDLAKVKPDLFERYLYVGATRAATYLGMICTGELPEKLKLLSDQFERSWA